MLGIYQRRPCFADFITGEEDYASGFFRELLEHDTAPERCSFMLTRIIHEASTAAADPGLSTALRSVGFLDVLSSTPAESSRRAPCIHARLRRLATNLHE